MDVVLHALEERIGVLNIFDHVNKCVCLCVYLVWNYIVIGLALKGFQNE